MANRKKDINTEFHEAILSEDLDKIKTLIKFGYDINSKDKNGCYAIHNAIYSGNVEIGEFLINAGANINAKDNKDCAPIELAIYLGFSGFVTMLLEKGADPLDTPDWDKFLKKHGEFHIIDILSSFVFGHFSNRYRTISITVGESVSIFVDKYGLSNLSQETISFLADHGNCAYCGKKAKKNLVPCNCINKEDNPISWVYIFPNEYCEQLHQLIKKDKRRLYDKNTKAKRMKKISESEGYYKGEDINKIWNIQNGECYFCDAKFPSIQEGVASGDRVFQIDHLIPISKGGTVWPDNIALVCPTCNRRKHNKSEASFWNVLKKEYGAEWVNERRKFASQNKKIKDQLTILRRKELKSR